MTHNRLPFCGSWSPARAQVDARAARYVALFVCNAVVLTAILLFRRWNRVRFWRFRLCVPSVPAEI
jgi:hypothetical protein